MKYVWPILPVLALAALLFAVLQASPASHRAKATAAVPVASSPPPAPAWELTFERTGGFAGLAERLTGNRLGLDARLEPLVQWLTALLGRRLDP